jgi:hypothetical protein
VPIAARALRGRRRGILMVRDQQRQPRQGNAYPKKPNSSFHAAWLLDQRPLLCLAIQTCTSFNDHPTLLFANLTWVGNRFILISL